MNGAHWRPTIDMYGSLRASIIFYDERTQQLKMCTVLLRKVQAVINEEIARSGGMTIPSDAPENSTRPIGDEDARKLGAMVMLMQARAHVELRERLQITTEPVTGSTRDNWDKRET